MERPELEDREAEKARAEEVFGQALSIIEGRDPDSWESDMLTHAADEIVRGNYRLAESYANNAMTPKSNRSSLAKFSSETSTLGALREAFRVAVAKPVRPYPHFGPIIFIDSERSREATRS